jgi:hypothetical protein
MPQGAINWMSFSIGNLLLKPHVNRQYPWIRNLPLPYSGGFKANPNSMPSMSISPKPVTRE